LNPVKTTYHILNGDCLKEQFPKQIGGEMIVIRECLVDGNVKSRDLEELFRLRAEYISELSGSDSVEDYYRQTASEFEKIMKIPEGSAVNVWFEDDLFCQVNFWFVAYLLFHHTQDCNVYLVRPKVHSRYGFGGLTTAELGQAHKDRIELNEINKIASLWQSYKMDDVKQLVKIADELKGKFPFIPDAVQAHVERIPKARHPGRPTVSLMKIMEELKTEEFGPVFREFSSRESIYGFGDLQVRRLLDKIKNER
jgi:hypothetical protein